MPDCGGVRNELQSGAEKLVRSRQRYPHCPSVHAPRYQSIPVTFFTLRRDLFLTQKFRFRNMRLQHALSSLVGGSNLGPSLFRVQRLTAFMILNEHRRSTRIPLELSIEVDGQPGSLPFKGITLIVNLHGALIRTLRPLDEGSNIYIRLVNGNEAQARVVRAVPDSPLTYGIELAEPRNIWNVAIPPCDWFDEKETLVH